MRGSREGIRLAAGRAHQGEWIIQMTDEEKTATKGRKIFWIQSGTLIGALCALSGVIHLFALIR
jgi:hypothetical protein